MPVQGLAGGKPIPHFDRVPPVRVRSRPPPVRWLRRSAAKLLGRSDRSRAQSRERPTDARRRVDTRRSADKLARRGSQGDRATGKEATLRLLRVRDLAAPPGDDLAIRRLSAPPRDDLVIRRLSPPADRPARGASLLQRSRQRDAGTGRASPEVAVVRDKGRRGPWTSGELLEQAAVKAGRASNIAEAKKLIGDGGFRWQGNPVEPTLEDAKRGWVMLRVSDTSLSPTSTDGGAALAQARQRPSAPERASIRLGVAERFSNNAEVEADEATGATNRRHLEDLSNQVLREREHAANEKLHARIDELRDELSRSDSPDAERELAALERDQDRATEHVANGIPLERLRAQIEEAHERRSISSWPTDARDLPIMERVLRQREQQDMAAWVNKCVTELLYIELTGSLDRLPPDVQKRFQEGDSLDVLAKHFYEDGGSLDALTKVLAQLPATEADKTEGGARGPRNWLDDGLEHLKEELATGWREWARFTSWSTLGRAIDQVERRVDRPRPYFDRLDDELKLTVLRDVVAQRADAAFAKFADSMPLEQVAATVQALKEEAKQHPTPRATAVAHLAEKAFTRRVRSAVAKHWGQASVDELEAGIRQFSLAAGGDPLRQAKADALQSLLDDSRAASERQIVIRSDGRQGTKEQFQRAEYLEYVRAGLDSLTGNFLQALMYRATGNPELAAAVGGMFMAAGLTAEARNTHVALNEDVKRDLDASRGQVHGPAATQTPRRTSDAEALLPKLGPTTRPPQTKIQPAPAPPGSAEPVEPTTAQARAAGGPPAESLGRRFWGRWSDYPNVRIGDREYANVAGRLYMPEAIERIRPSATPPSADSPYLKLDRGSRQRPIEGRGISPEWIEDVIARPDSRKQETKQTPLGEKLRVYYRSGSVLVVTEVLPDPPAGLPAEAVLTVIGH